MFESSYIVAATVEVVTTGPAVSTLRESLQLLFGDRQCCKVSKEKVEMCVPLAGSVHTLLVLVAMAEGCSPDHFLHWF